MPFLRTGDLGFVDNNELFITGRLKDLIIIRGRNLYPEDIEHSADRAYQGLRAGYCAAFAVDAGDRDQLVVVQEVEPRSRDLDAQAAMQAVRGAIAAQHELEVYAIVLVKAGTIPKTSSGKTRRSACRELFVSGKLEPLAVWEADSEDFAPDNGDAAAAPNPLTVSAAEIEAWLSDAIAARLRIPREAVRITTPFLDLGMGSMDAVEIAADLARWLGRRLSPVAIYSHPNIAALAGWLANSARTSASTAGAQSDPLLAADVDPEQWRQEVQSMTESEMESFIRQEMAREENN
jgi:acyl carrier protein